jgi:hypothetical protein
MRFRAIVLALAWLVACVAVLTSWRRAEGFALPRDLCDALIRENVSPRVLELCDLVADVPAVCTVGCDPLTLCSNPSVSVCQKLRIDTEPAMCDVTAVYMGANFSSVPYYRLFSIRRGGCLAATGGAFADGKGLREMLSRFPSHVSVARNAAVGRSALSDSWTVRLDGSGRSSVALPLTSDAFAEEAKKIPSAASVKYVPVLWEEVTSVTPDGTDTTHVLDPGNLKGWMDEVASTSGNTAIVHVTIEFDVPDTAAASVFGFEYTAPVPGAETPSPVSGTPMPPRGSVWLCAIVDVRLGKVIEAREIISSPDGAASICRSTGPDVTFDGDLPVTHAGTAPAVRAGCRKTGSLFFVRF